MMPQVPTATNHEAPAPLALVNLVRTGVVEEHLAEEWSWFQLSEQGRVISRVHCWESDRPVVVIGHHGPRAGQVDEDRCAEDRVAVVRRRSGGGAVVLAPGCLNYGFVRSIADESAWLDVAVSTARVLDALCAALDVPGLRVEGVGDLAIDGRKVSGHAQRRGRNTVLHHGTLLFDFDPRLATRYLTEPHRQPAYRVHRSHEAFLTNLPLTRAQCVTAVAEALGRL